MDNDIVLIDVVVVQHVLDYIAVIYNIVVILATLTNRGTVMDTNYDNILIQPCSGSFAVDYITLVPKLLVPSERIQKKLHRYRKSWQCLLGHHSSPEHGSNREHTDDGSIVCILCRGLNLDASLFEGNQAAFANINRGKPQTIRLVAAVLIGKVSRCGLACMAELQLPGTLWPDSPCGWSRMRRCRLS